ncbi:MAG: hypothetical protein JJD93_06860 [Ilumatobacteraceae bacterium]|nr:hypothetical protein [Ilumatobacteraceae bacterium]
MATKFISYAILFALLAGDGLAGNVPTAAAEPAVGVDPVIDVPAPWVWHTEDGVRRGGRAARIELDNADLNTAMSVWYRLAYVDGGSRLQVFEHYAATTRDPQSDIVRSENLAWRLANEALGADSDLASSNQLPSWARVRTGNDSGSSAGLIFTLAYIDLLTPGKLVGNLRIAGTGGVGSDGVVTPASGLDAKVAAAVLTRPDVIFTTSAPELIEHVTIVESQHTRNPDVGFTVGEWLNVSGYEQAGRKAAGHPGTIAVIVVHDLRQALAWLCGRTNNIITCAAARRTATIPIGTI